MLMYYLLTAATTMPYHWLLAMPFIGLTVTKWIGLLALAAALLHLPRKIPGGRSPHSAIWAFYVYFAVQMVSCLLRGSGISLNQDFTKLLSILALLLVVQIMTDTEEKFQRVVVVLVVSMAFSSNYVIRQFFQFYGLYKDARTGGVLGDPNYYAGMIVIWLPSCLVLLAEAKLPRMRLIHLACVGVSLIGFVLAGSRGGFLGIVAASVFLLLRSQYRLKLLAPIVGMALLTIPLMLLPTSPLQRILKPGQGDVRSSDARVTLWTAAWNMFLDHAIAGVGTDGFKEKLQEYEGPSAQLQFTAVHNTYLECAAQYGLLGMVPFLLTMVLTFRALGKVARGQPATTMTRLARAFQAGLVGYAVVAVFLSTWWFMMYWFLIFLSFALVSLANTNLPAAPTYSNERRVGGPVFPEPGVRAAQAGSRAGRHES